MNRRKFLGLFSAGVAGVALEQAIPLGRVWSFPSRIRLATLAEQGVLGHCVGFEWSAEFPMAIGDVVTVQGWPECFVVSRILDDGKVDLRHLRHHLMMRGQSPEKIAPIFIPAIPSGS